VRYSGNRPRGRVGTPVAACGAGAALRRCVSFVEPNQLAVEEGIAETVRRELEAMGHAVRVSAGLGNATGLTKHDPAV